MSFFGELAYIYQNSSGDKTANVNFFAVRPAEATEFGEITQRAITPFKVIQGHRFWYQSKAYDFLLVISTNLPPILHRFRDNRYI